MERICNDRRGFLTRVLGAIAGLAIVPALGTTAGAASRHRSRPRVRSWSRYRYSRPRRSWSRVRWSSRRVRPVYGYGPPAPPPPYAVYGGPVRVYVREYRPRLYSTLQLLEY